MNEKIARKKRMKESEKKRMELSLQKAKEAEEYYQRWKKNKDDSYKVSQKIYLFLIYCISICSTDSRVVKIDFKCVVREKGDFKDY